MIKYNRGEPRVKEQRFGWREGRMLRTLVSSQQRSIGSILSNGVATLRARPSVAAVANLSHVRMGWGAASTTSIRMLMSSPSIIIVVMQVVSNNDCME
jgi:hypothetical protein